MFLEARPRSHVLMTIYFGWFNKSLGASNRHMLCSASSEWLHVWSSSRAVRNIEHHVLRTDTVTGAEEECFFLNLPTPLVSRGSRSWYIPTHTLGIVFCLLQLSRHQRDEYPRKYSSGQVRSRQYLIIGRTGRISRFAAVLRRRECSGIHIFGVVYCFLVS